uniref:Ubiquitin carboxyl-terminal hydrolase n=1 Tax=Albugo laibachii Nc14 TaxID=890382 RepID=F0WV08_9STRA|nr:ubiquitinspecific protease putative [Albugo laibachii Nc14]|eukprot:CCA25244.1 ubiquitinspecific protease putative [Albugo laibachii Nc14]
MATMDVLPASFSHAHERLDGSKAVTKDVNLSSQCKSAVALLKERPITFVRARKQTQCTYANEFDSNDHNKLAKGEQKKSIISKNEILTLMEWRNARKIGPGFSNLGNTCYLNSVLQCLCYTPCLVQYLLQNRNTISKKKQVNSFCALQSIVNLFARVHLEVKSVQSQNAFHNKSLQHAKVMQPRDFVMNVRLLSKHFRIGRQEDAHEFFRSLLDSIQKSSLQAARFASDSDPLASTTMIPRIFGGKLKSSLKCVKCSYVSEHLEDFQDLSLEIHNGIQTITEAIDHFTAVEKLDETNAWKCTKCRLFNRAEKGLTIAEYPNVLVIQLKRFDGFLGGKLKKHISFPLELALPNTCKSKSQNRTKYTLYAILVHAGHSTDCGHYYAFVKGSSRQWYEMNDDSVRWVSADTVLSQRAYMLFYSRVIDKDTKPATTSISNVKEGAVQQRRSLPESADRSVNFNKESAPKTAVEGAQRVNEDYEISNVSPIESSERDRELMKDNDVEIPAIGTVVTFHVHQQDVMNATEAQMSSVFAGYNSRFRFSFDASTMWTISPSVQMQSVKVECESKGIQAKEFKRGDKATQSSLEPVPAHIVRPIRGGVNVSLYGREIEKWNEDSHTSSTASQDANLSTAHDRILGNLVQEDHQRRQLGRLDSWNQTLDTGKLKKIRQKRDFVSNEGRSNSFQHAQEAKRARYGKTDKC